MAEDGDLIRRADSLINPEADPAGVDRREGSRRLRRRRSFIASVDRPVKPTPPDRNGAEDEDLPVLTEVVSPETLPEAKAADIETELRSMLATDLADVVDRQLRNDLPELIKAALCGAAEQLQRGLATTIETALHDFLSQRGQMRLPLEDPGDGLQGTPDAP
jgi:hypothetical protein